MEIWEIKQFILVITCWRFGTTCRFHLQSYVSTPSSSFKTPLEMGPIGCPETSVRNDHFSLLNIAGERRFQLVCGRTYITHGEMFLDLSV